MVTHPERRAATQAAILDAAESAFAELGFAGARVDAIAREAGIRRASLFHYYPDKQALHAAVIERRVLPYLEQIAKLLEAGEATPAPADLAARSAGGLALVVEGISLQADFVLRHPRTAKIFLRELLDQAPGRPSPLAEAARSIIDRVARFLEARGREGLCDPVDPETLVHAVAGATLLHLMSRPAAPGEADPDEDALAAHKSHLAGLVTRLLGIEPSADRAPDPAE